VVLVIVVVVVVVVVAAAVAAVDQVKNDHCCTGIISCSSNRKECSLSFMKSIILSLKRVMERKVGEE
jgi:hypothetical protein